jgi:DNA-binding HxlR family transcriptional regulator
LCRKISKYVALHTEKVPTSESFETALARKFKNLGATRDLVKVLRREGSFEILILLREIGEPRSTDIERLLMQAGVSESTVWERLRNLKALGIVENPPADKNAKGTVTKNRLTPAGRKLMDALYDLNKELSELPRPTITIDQSFKPER